MVLSGNVIAFKNVLKEPLSNSTKGSFTGYFAEPHKTECSKIWKIPLSLYGIVLKLMLKLLLISSFLKNTRRAFVLTCSYK